MITKFRPFILFSVAAILFSCPPPPPQGDDGLAFLSISLPAGFDASAVTCVRTDAPDAGGIPPDYVIAGRAFDLAYDGQASTDFGGELARAVFSYADLDLEALGAKEDFQAFSYDEALSRYVVTEACVVDKAAKSVTIYTSHFTVFVITALLPSADGTVILPGGVSAGIASATDPAALRAPIFISIDENFRYYRDRTYYIRPWMDPAAPGYSAENAKAVSDLGFDGAVGLSTVNDDKYYEGIDYFSYTAARDLDVFVMYDTRGGGSRFNFDQDAPWLRNGFAILRDPSNQPYFMQTTDEVAYYSIYHRRYAAGEQVRLDGNRRGVTDVRINTNWWAVIRPADLGPESSGLDEFIPASTRPFPVSSLAVSMDGTDVILGWTLPTGGPTIDRVLVRRSFRAYPANPYDGEEPAGSPIGDSGFRDGSVPEGASAYYAVFTLLPDDTPSFPAYAGIIASGAGTPLPAIVSTDPAAGSAGVNRGSSAFLVFNTALDPACADSSHFSIRSEGAAVLCAVAITMGGRCIEIDPVDALPASSLIQVVAESTVSDAAGHFLSRDFSFTFTTSDAAPSGGTGVVIDPDMDDPVAVAVSGAVSGLHAPANQALSASLTPAVPDATIQWFVNGASAGGGADIALTGLAAGYYRVDAVAIRLGSYIGSGSVEFDVIE